MTARKLPLSESGKPTRVFLTQRFEALAEEIEHSLGKSDDSFGFERAPGVPIAASDLSCLSPDVVVVNVDEMQNEEWETLIRLRAAAPGYKIYGLSGHPDSKHSHPQCNDACDGVFALTPDLDELKKRLVSIRR